MTTPQPEPARKTSRVDSLLEYAGLALLVGFFWFVWPPAVLAAGGLVLLFVSNARERERERRARHAVSRKPMLERLIGALVALQGSR